MTIRYRDLHLNIFRAFQDPRAYNLQWTNKTLTKYVGIILIKFYLIIKNNLHLFFLGLSWNVEMNCVLILMQLMF